MVDLHVAGDDVGLTEAEGAAAEIEAFDDAGRRDVAAHRDVSKASIPGGREADRAGDGGVLGRSVEERGGAAHDERRRGGAGVRGGVPTLLAPLAEGEPAEVGEARGEREL